MDWQFTAIIHLRSGDAVSPTLVDSVRRSVRGVGEINYEPKEALITVRYDQELTGLADIVRSIEDCGSSVSGVAQRRDPVRRQSIEKAFSETLV